MRSTFPDRHLKMLDTGTRSGMPFAHAAVHMSAPHVSQAMIDAYVFLKGDQAFILAMWSKRDDFVHYISDFSNIAHSFRNYDIKRDGDIPRIALHNWQPNDSWEILASRSKHILGRFTADKLAALNGMGTTEHPVTGTLIKTVR